MDAWAAVRWWLLSRGASVLVLVLVEARTRKDVWYFSKSLDHLHRHGLQHTLAEYPLPAVAAIALPWLVAKAFGVAHGYVALFGAIALATDAVFTWLLVRAQAHRTALVAWLAGIPLLGGMTYFRFDLLPAVLVGVAVLMLATRPAVSMLSVSVATAVKLWPVVAIPALLAGTHRRVRGLLVPLIVGAVTAGVCVAVAGWSRLLSPLSYEAHRGLQVESVLASPVMVGWSLRGGWRTRFTRFHDREVVGPGVHALLAASSVALVVLAVVLTAVWWRLLRAPGPARPEPVVWATLAAISGFLVVDKVVSPQYLVWLLAVVAAGLAVTAGSRRLWRWSLLLLVAAALTQVEYPLTYHGLARHSWLTDVAVPALVVRNALLVLLSVLAFAHAWRTSGRRRQDDDAPAALVQRPL